MPVKKINYIDSGVEKSVAFLKTQFIEARNIPSVSDRNVTFIHCCRIPASQSHIQTTIKKSAALRATCSLICNVMCSCIWLNTMEETAYK
jgi:hypothetical protein